MSLDSSALRSLVPSSILPYYVPPFSPLTLIPKSLNFIDGDGIDGMLVRTKNPLEEVKPRPLSPDPFFN